LRRFQSKGKRHNQDWRRLQAGRAANSGRGRPPTRWRRVFQQAEKRGASGHGLAALGGCAAPVQHNLQIEQEGGRKTLFGGWLERVEASMQQELGNLWRIP